MTSGGARARSGPAPDPNALRRDRKADAAGWTTLPAKHDMAQPDWPLTKPSRREIELWSSEWSRPQAVMWHRNGSEVDVALYVRRLAEAEAPESSVALSTLVRQLREDLGLSQTGLARHRWRVAADEVAERRGTTEKPARASARDRLKAVNGGSA